MNKSLKKAGYTGFKLSLILFLVLYIIYTVYYFIERKALVCFSFGGNSNCDIISYLVVTSVIFLYYFIFIGLPLTIIWYVVWYLRSKKRGHRH